MASGSAKGKQKKSSDIDELLEQGQLVLGVVDARVGRDAQRLALAAQDAQPGRVEGAEPQAPGAIAERRLQPPAHLAGGAVGEGEAEDAPGRRALLDEAPDALGEHARLAAASAGDDEAGPLPVIDGLLLGCVEL